MALIKCPECGGQVSDTAKLCPHCGFEVKTRLAERAEADEELAIARQLLAPGGRAVIRFLNITRREFDGDNEVYLQYQVYLFKGQKRSLFSTKDDLKQLRVIDLDGNAGRYIYANKCYPLRNAMFAIELDGPADIVITESYLYVRGTYRFHVEPGHAYRIRNVYDPSTKLHWRMELDMFL